MYVSEMFDGVFAVYEGYNCLFYIFFMVGALFLVSE